MLTDYLWIVLMKRLPKKKKNSQFSKFFVIDKNYHNQQNTTTRTDQQRARDVVKRDSYNLYVHLFVPEQEKSGMTFGCSGDPHA